MNRFRVVDSSFFSVVGVSHQTTDIATREKFTLNKEAVQSLIADYLQMKGESIFVLSTCNRTEIYALTNSTDELIQLFRNYSRVDDNTFDEQVYCLKNEVAIHHLFNVGVGKESQIPGDFQIIGQLKEAFKIAKSMNATNAFMERLINTVTQCSKMVKNKTDFSSGATSTSYAAIEFIKNKLPDFQEKNFLLYGSGKIGRHVCENLVKQVKASQITLVNRTAEHAKELSIKFGIQQGKYDEMENLISGADVILVSTAAETYTITSNMVKESGKVIVDLSMPRNVDPDLGQKGNDIISLDQLSLITSRTLEERKRETTAVNKLVAKYFDEFMEWLEQRRLVPTIAAIRERLDQIRDTEINRFKKENESYDEEHLQILSSEIIRKFTNQLSGQLKSLPSDNLEFVHHLFNIDSRKV